MDDLISENLLYSPQYVQLMALGRHYGVSIFTCTQETRSISPKSLGNMNLLVIGRVSNQDRLEELLTSFNAGLGDTKKERRDKVLQLFTTALGRATRGFLLIRPHEFEVHDRFLDLNWQRLL